MYTSFNITTKLASKNKQKKQPQHNLKFTQKGFTFCWLLGIMKVSAELEMCKQNLPAILEIKWIELGLLQLPINI